MAALIEQFTAGPVARATLYRAGAQPGVRTALWVSLNSAPLPGISNPGASAGLWLAQVAAGKVGCFLSRNAPTGRSVGGTVIRDLPCLNPASTWLRELAQAVSHTSGAATQPELELTALQRAVGAFCDELDADILQAVRASEPATPGVYNHFLHGDSIVRRNRLQAAQVHPFFAATLRLDWRLRRSVDGGLPLTAQLAAHHGVREATVRRVRKLQPASATAAAHARLLKHAEAFPDWPLPTEPEDLAVFERIAPGLEALAGRTGMPLPRLAKPFRESWSRGLAEVEDRIGAPLDPDTILEMMHCAYQYGVRPAVQLALPRSHHAPTLAASPPDAFFQLWFGTHGLLRLARIAKRWNDSFNRFSLERLAGDLAATPESPLAWPGFLETGAMHNELRIVELTSRAALELEGRRLEHCVASYAAKCLLADSSIFSIRDASGTPLSTFEVRVSTSGVPRLLKHCARNNATPPDQEQAVAQRFVERVLGGVPPERIAQIQRTRRDLGTRVRALLPSLNTTGAALSEEERRQLAEAVAIAHPAQAKRRGIVVFLTQYGEDVLTGMGLKLDSRTRPAPPSAWRLISCK